MIDKENRQDRIRVLHKIVAVNRSGNTRKMQIAVVG